MTSIEKKLTRLKVDLARNPRCADLWVTKARLLQLMNAGELPPVEKCILKALRLSPDNLEALEEAAHFYDAVVVDRRRAVKYAKRYIQLAGKVVSDMQTIISDSD